MNESRPVIFGEVLYDCFPDGSRVLGGAPFNVAWHCQAFGLSPLFISSVGTDVMGDEIRSAMTEWGMDTQGLQIDKEHPTGIVDVQFHQGEPHYNIVENSAWDFIYADRLPEISTNGRLYHGSLALRSACNQQTLNQLRKIPGLSVFADINLRPPWWTSGLVNEYLPGCRWLKINEDELRMIVPQGERLDDRVGRLRTLLSLDMLIITLGEKGAIAIDQAGMREMISPATDKPVIDTVGAGDAFSSVMLMAQIKGWPLITSLQRAQAFASAIVGIRGATIRDRQFYQPFIDDWQL